VSGTTKAALGCLSVLVGIVAAVYAAYAFLLYGFLQACWDGPVSGGCGRNPFVGLAVPIVALAIFVTAGVLGYRLISRGLNQNRRDYYRAREASGWSDDT
jgi:hypothetical protein